MRNRLLIPLLLLCATGAAAQIPSITTNSKIRFTEGNTIFDRTVGDIFSTIDVSLTTGVTGTLPVANGGTGISSLTANRIPYGNGTSAFQSSSSLTYDGTTLTGQPRISTSGTESTGSSITTANFQSILTGTANSLTLRGIRLDSRHNNDGTVTGNALYGFDGQVQFGNTNAATAGTATGIFNFVQSYSPNISQLYGIYTRMQERSASGDLNNRIAARFDLEKVVLDSDGHTGVGIQGQVVDQTTNGRWNTGTGMSFAATNCKTGYGALVTMSNTRGTANTQYGFYLNNNASGASTGVSNAYGIYLSTSAGTSGNITNYYGIYQNTTPTGATLAYMLYSGNSSNRIYHAGPLSVGVDDGGASAKVVVRGAGNTSGTNALLAENSDGTDIFTVRNDQMSSFGTSPQSTVRLTVRGASSDTTSTGFQVQRSSGTPTFAVRNDGKVTINNASPYELLTVPGKVRADGFVLTPQVESGSRGQIIFSDAGTNVSGYVTLGDEGRAMAILPTMIERHVLDWAVDWTTGRKGAFWTVPARFDGWKISKVYIEVTAIGSGAGDDELSIEIGGVVEGVQVVTAGTHTLIMDDVINTDDVITFNITEVSATPAQGLNVSLELSKI